MSNSKTLINILIVLLLLGAGLVVYFYFFGGSTETEPTGVQAVPFGGLGGANAPVGQTQTSEFVTLLEDLRSVDLNSPIFSNPAFTGGLQDFTTPLPDRLKGRSNPFAPLGNSIR